MIRLTKHFLLIGFFAIVAVTAFTGVAHAQGSRKDDIVFNAQGRPMAGATVRVCTSAATGQPCSPLALVYSDAALSQALANPMTADGLGNYTFYAAPGRYEIEISGPGITTKQMPNVILPSDPSSPTFTTVTTTSGISAFSLSLTGNLTVNGSTAVLGTLSVGGAPVPSANSDNQWGTNQRFKGPIPYRDITAYMPAGGCSTTNISDPAATGSISSGSNTLALSTAADFKNGCGISIQHAGPAATIASPSTCTITGVSTSGGVVTMTATACGLFNIYSFDEGLTISGCSISGFNGTFPFVTASSTTFSYANATTGSPTGCQVSFLLGWAHGITGSTTYNYKIAPIDQYGGVGAAVGPITITNGNAAVAAMANWEGAWSSGTTYSINQTVTYANGVYYSLVNSNTGNTPSTSPTDWAQQTYYSFNWIGFPQVQGRRGTAIYSDQGAGGAYKCVGISYTYGYEDLGLSAPCPDFVPSTPPSTPTAQTLTTTIASGGGTTTLTLTAAASNNASSQPVHDDENMFLASCLTDLNNDQYSAPTYEGGSAYCYIPAGLWAFNSDFPTDTFAPQEGAEIVVAGGIQLQTWPWMGGTAGSHYSIIGQGNSGGQQNYSSYPTVFLQTGEHVPAAFVLVNGGIGKLEGFSTTRGSFGDGIVIDGGAGIEIDNMILGVAPNDPIPPYPGSNGVPIRDEGDTIGLWVNNVTLAPKADGFPCSALFTNSNYDGNGFADIYFSNVRLLYHHFCVESPGGNVGSSLGLTLDGMNISEDHGDYPTGGFFMDDGGRNEATGANTTSLFTSVVMSGTFQNADAPNQNLVQFRGSYTADFSISGNTGSWNPIGNCHSLSTLCATGNAELFVQGTSYSNLVGMPTNTYDGPINSGAEYFIQYPFVIGSGPGDWLNTPQKPALADVLPAPHTLSVASTGSGSLAAGQYCMVIVGLDNQSTPGQTISSPEVCQTVPASSSISLSWTVPTVVGYLYSNYQLWFGSTPGGENQYVLTAGGAGSSATVTYTFTSTSGATGGTLPAYPAAYETWIERAIDSPSCILCAPASSSRFQLGVGEPAPPSGDKLAVKGGVLDAEGGFKSVLATKSSAYTLATSDYWVNVTGTTTITVPHATTGNHWVVFNSGSGTVTVQADSGNINGGANITLSANTGKEIACDGTNCFAH